MAKTKNATHHNQNKKDHKNGIKRVNIKKVPFRKRGMELKYSHHRKRAARANNAINIKARLAKLPQVIEISKSKFAAYTAKRNKILQERRAAHNVVMEAVRAECKKCHDALASQQPSALDAVAKHEESLTPVSCLAW